MKPLIGIIGAGTCNARVYDLAREAGAQAANNGYGIVCGGLGGVMEAAALGCRENGGLTVGIIPHEEAAHANEFIDIVIPSGMGIMRNLLVVRSAAGIIAIDGKYGTLSEIAFALQLAKPIVGIGTWDISEHIVAVANAEQAVVKLLELIEADSALKS